LIFIDIFASLIFRMTFPFYATFSYIKNSFIKNNDIIFLVRSVKNIIFLLKIVYYLRSDYQKVTYLSKKNVLIEVISDVFEVFEMLTTDRKKSNRYTKE